MTTKTTTKTTTTTTFPHWIFGYGSLICPSSRAVTAPSLQGRRATPVSVRHLERLWSFPVTECGMTFMGIRPNPQSRAACVGVLVPVSDEELVQFDARELGYDRIALPHHHVERIAFLEDNGGDQEPSKQTEAAAAANQLCYFDQLAATTTHPNDKSSSVLPKVWVYIQQAPSPVRHDAPIAQTYLDVILRGCLTISDQFAHQFIATTRGWHVEDFHENDKDDENDGDESHNPKASTTPTTPTETPPVQTFWVDDRNDPIYVRADPTYSQQFGHELDVLLAALRPGELAHRYRRRPLS